MRSHEVSGTTPLTWPYFLIPLHVRGQPRNEAFGSNHKILRCNVIVISWFLFLCVVVTLSGQNVLPVACGGGQNEFVTAMVHGIPALVSFVPIKSCSFLYSFQFHWIKCNYVLEPLLFQRFGHMGRDDREISEWKENRKECCVTKNVIALQLSCS
jgi:hypothetical protein